MSRSRYNRIVWFFGRIVLSIIYWDIFLPWIGLRKLSRRTRPERMRKIAVAFRAQAIALGGVMIKVGQFMSARLDVLPKEITDELAGLQDEVRAEPFEAIRPVIESEFGRPLEEMFCEFDPQAMAAASIGQVHYARLAGTCAVGSTPESGQAVVVKVQRPNIGMIVDTDLAALRVVIGWLKRYPPVAKHANVEALLQEFSSSLYEEIDYLHEGKNAETFAANFAARPEICVPAVVWSHTARRVLTLERIDAIKISDYAALEAAGISRAEVAELLFGTYLKQIFEDLFFHADPHPGNLFVLPLAQPENGRSWKLVFVDFGMTGVLAESLIRDLREILIAVGTQDAKRIIRAYQSMGILLPGADLDLLERATARVFETVWGKTAPELMGMHNTEAVEFVNEFGDLLRDVPFQAPQNIILMARCVSILSGICTGLDPAFNVWKNITPYVRKLVEAEGAGGQSGLQFWLKEAGAIATTLIALPRKTDALIGRLEQGRLEVRTPALTDQVRRLERSQRRQTAAIVFGACLLAGVQLYLGGALLPAGVLGAAAVLALGAALFSR